MRQKTLEQIDSAVATLENVFLDNKDTEPVTLAYAIEYCYGYFISDQDTTYGFDRSARFDGKDAILNEIRSKILNSTDIKLIHKEATHEQS